jgi:hypothetical protein
MTSTRRSARPAWRWMGISGLAVLAAPGVALARPVDLFIERAATSEAGDRCGLFSPEVAAALAAATQQARGAALRAGSDARTLTSLERDARFRAARLECDSERVVDAANRVKSAFAGYQRISRMVYPGDVADWRADRTTGRAARWRLSQDSRFGADRMTFGLAGWDGANGLLAVATFADGRTPYAARLVMRDGARTLGPYLITTGKAAPLSAKLPPRTATRSYLAEARSPAGPELLPKAVEAGWAFRFPVAAAQALGDLDPRESIAVEFLFSGERVRTAYVEVGDFAAGRAFLRLASR